MCPHTLMCVMCPHTLMCVMCPHTLICQCVYTCISDAYAQNLEMAATHTLCLCNFHCYDDRATGQRYDVLVEHLTEQSAGGIDMLVSMHTSGKLPPLLPLECCTALSIPNSGAQLQVYWLFLSLNAVAWADITNYLVEILVMSCRTINIIQQ